MGNEGKGIKLGLTIVFVTIAVVLIIIFSFNGVTVENRHQAVSIDNADKSIVFDVKTGQHVSGLLNYTGDDSGTWFAIYDPNGNHLITASNSYGNHSGSFSFTATMDGKYYSWIGKDYFGTSYIDYQYTVSPAILGLDKTELIIIVAAVGGFLAALTALSHFGKLKKRKTAQK
jgi:hypothetical protein